MTLEQQVWEKTKTKTIGQLLTHAVFTLVADGLEPTAKMIASHLELMREGSSPDLAVNRMMAEVLADLVRMLEAGDLDVHIERLRRDAAHV